MMRVTKDQWLNVMRAAVVLAAGCWLEAQANWSFAALESAVRTVSAMDRLSDAERRAVQSIASSVEDLRARYRKTFGAAADEAATVQKKLPAEFIRSMQADTAVLDKLTPDSSDRLGILQDIEKDLALKADFLESSFGIGGGFPAVVKVTVETFHDGKKVDGLWVRSNPRRYGITPDPLFVFNSATSPTTANLPPGLFVIWVESPDRKVIASQPMELGQGGRDSEAIRFSLP